MTRIIILTLMLSFFGLGKSNAQNDKKLTDETENAKGIIGRYYENDLPVIMKFVNELPEKKVMSKLPFLTVVSWKYDGTKNNGMPLTEVNNRMIILEDAIENSMNSTELFTHVYSRTGNNLKEFAYYSSSQKDFMEILNRTLEKHDAYPIEINFYEDKEWTDFKTVIKDFKK
ncbi:DUF695 domain-containing protein [Thalassobellus citreus]|uniref:DUF695 domain-containing protein n=1 Tax=Thalassobellus citreus TaxID=3367752 RepID=UPI00378FE44C